MMDKITLKRPPYAVKIVIYNYVFCWLLFHAKFDCNYIQSFVPCIYYGIWL